MLYPRPHLLFVISGETGWDIFKPVSSWEDYLSAGITGAVTGIMGAVMPGFGQTIGGRLFDAVLRPTLTQTIEIASGKRTDFNAVDMAKSATIRFATSFLRMPGKSGGNMLSNSIISQAEKIIAGAGQKFVQGLSVNISRGIIKKIREHLGF